MTTTRELYNELVGKRLDRYGTFYQCRRIVIEARIRASSNVGVTHAFLAENDPRLAPKFERFAMACLLDKLSMTKSADTSVAKWFASKGVNV